MSNTTPPDDPARRLRILRVSNALLCDLLLLPPGTEIVGVSDQLYFHTGDLAVKVRHPDFAPVPDGHAHPVVVPTYRVESTAKFDGWR